MLDRSNEYMQRARGRAAIRFKAAGLSHLFQSGCAKVLLPRPYGGINEAVMINTSGGITGGDRLEFSGEAEAGAALCITTQAAERIYRASAGEARIINNLTLGKDARLEWLPQETILFEGSRLKRQLNVTMAESSVLLALETLVLGRAAAGECLKDVNFNDQWRVRRDGELIYADGLRFQGLDSSGLATLKGTRAMTSLLYVAPDAQQRLPEARGLIKGMDAAASAWNGMLCVRFVAPDLQPLRAGLMQFLIGFRGEDLPRVWHM